MPPMPGSTAKDKDARKRRNAQIARRCFVYYERNGALYIFFALHVLHSTQEPYAACASDYFNTDRVLELTTLVGKLIGTNLLFRHFVYQT